MLIDQQPPGAAHGADVDSQGNGTVTGQRLYQLIRQRGPVTEHTFEITFPDPGVQAYAFTFGWTGANMLRGVFHHIGAERRAAGPDPERRDYGSFASFSDLDGNGWLLQAVASGLPDDLVGVAPRTGRQTAPDAPAGARCGPRSESWRATRSASWWRSQRRSW